MKPERVEELLKEYDERKAKKREKSEYLNSLIADEDIDLDEPIVRGFGLIEGSWLDTPDDKKIRLWRKFIQKRGKPPPLKVDSDSWKAIQIYKRAEYKKSLEESSSFMIIGSSSPCYVDKKSYQKDLMDIANQAAFPLMAVALMLAAIGNCAAKFIV